MILEVAKWCMLNQVFQQIVSKKRSRNYVSFIHSLLCVYKVYNNEYINLSIISVSYFSYDIVYILFNFSKSEIMILYHHIVCISFLLELNELNEYNLFYTYGIGELSNFFTYIVYDMLKLDISKTIVNNAKKIQIMWYTFFRVIYFTYLFYSKYDLYLLLNGYNQLGGLSIYCLGLLWTFNQARFLI